MENLQVLVIDSLGLHTLFCLFSIANSSFEPHLILIEYILYVKKDYFFSIFYKMLVFIKHMIYSSSLNSFILVTELLIIPLSVKKYILVCLCRKCLIMFFQCLAFREL